MKRFKDLEIIGPERRLLALVEVVSANLPPDWHRDHAAEKLLEGIDPEGKDAGFAFARDLKNGDPPAGVFLARESERLYIPNIVPRESGQLSVAQYNRILDEFAAILKEHLPQDGVIQMKVGSDSVAITEWISSEAAELLKRFSVLANQSTGSSHPRDFERWAAFLIKVHKESVALHSNVLQQWLIEEWDWPPDRASKLAMEYEFARDLLNYYDKSQ